MATTRKPTTTSKATSSKAKAAPKATSKAKAGQADTADTAEPTQAKRVLVPAPEGWQATYSNTGFVRYARRVRETGHPITAYRTSAASTPEQRKLVDDWAKAGQVGEFVVVDHTAGTVRAFGSWAPAYAYTRQLAAPAAPLAASTLRSLGKAGLGALGQ